MVSHCPHLHPLYGQPILKGQPSVLGQQKVFPTGFPETPGMASSSFTAPLPSCYFNCKEKLFANVFPPELNKGCQTSRSLELGRLRHQYSMKTPGEASTVCPCTGGGNSKNSQQGHFALDSPLMWHPYFSVQSCREFNSVMSQRVSQVVSLSHQCGMV